MIQRSFEHPIDLSDHFAAGGATLQTDPSHLLIGEENALLIAIAEEWLTRDDIYNPLLLVGDSGVGKSRFAELLVEQFRVEHRSSNIQTLPASDFARAYADAVKADATDDFHARFSRLHLLLLDNLDELRGKDAAQQALREVIDQLTAVNSRVIVVSRIAPRSDRRIMPSLASRLYSGMVAPVSLPAESTRRAILNQEIDRLGIEITDEAFDLLSNSLALAPPLLTHAVAQLSLEDQPIEVATAQRLITEELGIRQPTLAKITSTVARRFSLKSSDLKGKRRQRRLVQARGVAMLLARQLAGMSYQKIGAHFGNRDHTTVMHACRQTEVLIVTDENTRFAFEELSQKLRA